MPCQQNRRVGVDVAAELAGCRRLLPKTTLLGGAAAAPNRDAHVDKAGTAAATPLLLPLSQAAHLGLALLADGAGGEGQHHRALVHAAVVARKLRALLEGIDVDLGADVVSVRLEHLQLRARGGSSCGVSEQRGGG